MIKSNVLKIKECTHNVNAYINFGVYTTEYKPIQIVGGHRV